MATQELELALIVESPYQGRMIRPLSRRGKTDDLALKELEKSIRDQGLLTPVIVRPSGDNYELIDGHRRVEVYRRLKLNKIPVLVKDVDDEKAQVYSIIGNLHRQSLSTIEKAVAFKKIMDSGVFSSVKDFSKSIGKHDSYVGDFLNTLHMDQRIIDDLAVNKTIEDSRLLRAIRKVEKAEDNKSDLQWELYQRVCNENLSRQQVIELVSQEIGKGQKKSPVSMKQSGKSVYFKIGQVQADQAQEIKRMIEEYLNGLEAE